MQNWLTKRLVQCLCGASLLALCTAAQAYEYLGFDIRGYGSAGYLKSDNNNYLTAETKDGTFEAYDFGLNIGRDLLPDLRIGAQGVIRNLGTMGKGTPRIDWANVDYRPFDQFGIRLGIVKLPIGLYNEGRDLDMLRTTVFMPQGVYNEQLRDFFVGNQGGQIYGRLDAGPVGAFNYILSLTTLDIESDSPWAGYFVDNVLLNMGLQRGVPGAFPRQSFWANVDYQRTAGLTWETPLEGLRLGGTFDQLKGDIEVRTRNPMLPKFDLDLKLKHYYVLSAEYTREALRVVGEYMNADFEVDVKLPGSSTISRKSEGYYGQVSYRFSERLELSTYYSIYYPNTEDRDGKTFKQISQAVGKPGLYPDYLGWQKDACIAARFDITMNWLIKLEYHYIDGVGQLYPADNPDGLSRYWNFFAIKTTYTF